MKLLSALLLVVALSACSKKDSASAPQGPTPPAAAAACPAGGTPQAEAKECGAVLKGCCFIDAAAACAAAGCGDQCIQAESWPVQVSCPSANAPAEGEVK